MSPRATDRLRRSPKTTAMGLGLIVAGALSACGGAVPSTQLVDARLAYQQASDGNAAQYAPGDLLDARRALDAAEIAYRDNRDPTYWFLHTHIGFTLNVSL